MLELYDTNVRSVVAAERAARLARTMTETREAVSIRRRIGAFLVRLGERLESREPECISPAPVEG